MGNQFTTGAIRPLGGVMHRGFDTSPARRTRMHCIICSTGTVSRAPVCVQFFPQGKKRYNGVPSRQIFVHCGWKTAGLHPRRAAPPLSGWCWASSLRCCCSSRCWSSSSGAAVMIQTSPPSIAALFCFFSCATALWPFWVVIISHHRRHDTGDPSPIRWRAETVWRLFGLHLVVSVRTPLS